MTSLSERKFTVEPLAPPGRAFPGTTQIRLALFVLGNSSESDLETSVVVTEKSGSARSTACSPSQGISGICLDAACRKKDFEKRTTRLKPWRRNPRDIASAVVSQLIGDGCVYSGSHETTFGRRQELAGKINRMESLSSNSEKCRLLLAWPAFRDELSATRLQVWRIPEYRGKY